MQVTEETKVFGEGELGKAPEGYVVIIFLFIEIAKVVMAVIMIVNVVTSHYDDYKRNSAMFLSFMTNCSPTWAGCLPSDCFL